MIFCVEDDDGIRELMAYTLTLSGFETKSFSTPQTFWKALQIERPELVLLDIMLPGEDGLSILKKLRSDAATKDTPVIMTTAKVTEYDRVIGLDSGADDYLSKPFGMMEMVSRVKAVLRRTMQKNETALLRIGELQINTNEHSVSVSGHRAVLTLKEYELLKLFMRNAGLVFTRDQLLHRIWGTDFIGETRTVDVHIGTLRTKIGACGEYIETVRGVGYRMRKTK